uniref:Uncharacterized protein n=1 Tax=Setaria italica TaxID=4555 RepID=K3XMH6_SETIT
MRRGATTASSSATSGGGHDSPPVFIPLPPVCGRALPATRRRRRAPRRREGGGRRTDPAPPPPDFLGIDRWCMLLVLCVTIDGWHRRISSVHVVLLHRRVRMRIDRMGAIYLYRDLIGVMDWMDSFYAQVGLSVFACASSKYICVYCSVQTFDSSAITTICSAGHYLLTHYRVVYL